MITVFTPTYNREKDIVKLYESLCQQKYKNFEWLIVDDGSIDSTCELITDLKKQKKINIKYFHQKNSGKHVAFNKGIKLAAGEIFICVDSDDQLTEDALLTINEDYEKYNKHDDICGFVYLKGYNETNPITKEFIKNESIENYNDYIINTNFKGDKAEVFITKILKNYSFPVFDDEKFLAEGFLWSKIGRNYNYVFKNKIIYICEYLPNGLTKSGRKLRINNPRGGMEHAIEYTNKKVYKLKIRVKNILLYQVYSRFYHKKTKDKINNNLGIIGILIKFPSWLLYKYWDKKYN